MAPDIPIGLWKGSGQTMARRAEDMQDEEEDNRAGVGWKMSR